MNWFRNLRISFKLLLAFTVFTALFVLSMALALHELSLLNRKTGTIVSTWLPGIQAVTDMKTSIANYRLGEYRYLMSRTPEELQKNIVLLADALNQLSRDEEIYIPMISSGEQQALYDRYHDELAVYLEMSQAMISLMEEGRQEEATVLITNNSFLQYELLVNELRTLVDDNIRSSRQAGKEIEATYDASFTLVVSLLALCVLFASALAFGLARAIGRPLQILRTTAEKIADGDIDQSVTVHSRDEVGILATAFNTMIAHIRESMQQEQRQQQYLNECVETMLVQMDRFAEGNLTVYLERRQDDAIGRLYTGFNRAMEKIRAMMIEVDTAVRTTSSSAIQIGISTEQLAAGAQELSSQTQTIATAVEQMTRTVTDNSHSAATAAHLAASNGEVARTGNDVVARTAKTISSIAGVVRESSATVERLGASGREIEEILSVINEIADQTNLLALNAAIEAARAGSHGRGFAVVADEVRKLADRTTGATREIAGIIHKIQKETAEAVSAMHRGTQEVDEGLNLAQQANTSLDSILASSLNVRLMMQNIATASEQQSTTSEEIARSMDSMASVVDRSTGDISSIADSAVWLTDVTSRLSSLVGQFHLYPDDQNGAPEPFDCAEQFFSAS